MKLRMRRKYAYPRLSIKLAQRHQELSIHQAHLDDLIATDNTLGVSGYTVLTAGYQRWLDSLVHMISSQERRASVSSMVLYLFIVR